MMADKVNNGDNTREIVKHLFLEGIELKQAGEQVEALKKFDEAQ